MRGIRPSAALLPLLAVGLALGTAAAAADAPGDRCGPDPASHADPAWSTADLADEGSQTPAPKISFRKAARRILPPRSVLRSAPDAILLPASHHGFGRPMVAAAVRVANAADISRLCRRLL